MLFAAVVVAVGFLRGLRAIVGLTATVAILFLFAFPTILNGANPVFIAIIWSLSILAINLQLTHGWSRATLVAFASTLAGLLLAWAFESWFVSFAHLSGLASEESVLLFLDHLPPTVLPSGILLAGIVVGATGALDDVAIAQGEIVGELRHANPALDGKELFVRSMRVGRHHIASITNTLVLAYAGAALPMLLLFFATSSLSYTDFLNTEAVAEEIVRTLAGTIALVLTVPLSTWFAVKFDKR